MKLFLLALLCANISYCTAQEIIRSTLGVSGTTATIPVSEGNYLIQQSIGQASVTGILNSDKIVARQGFIQSPRIRGNVILSQDDIEAVIHPNPFNHQLNILFNENLEEDLQISIYDLLGRLVYKSEISASKEIGINLGLLSSAAYALKIYSGNKKFQAKIIKQ